jgi:hypothetical protein
LATTLVLTADLLLLDLLNYSEGVFESSTIYRGKFSLFIDLFGDAIIIGSLLGFVISMVLVIDNSEFFAVGTLAL